MRPTIAILVLLLATPSFAAMSREDFAREIRRRIDEKICPLTVIRGETGESIAALKEHHLYDLANLNSENPLDEAEDLIRYSGTKGTRTGQKIYDLDRWFQDIQVRRLIAEIDRMLKEQRDLGPSTTPLYLSIVGLGRTANEFPLLVDLVDGTLDRLRGSGTKEELVAHLNLRFGIYDVMREALSSADQRHELIKMAYPWTADRIDVRFYDMTIPGFYATWSDRKLGLVLARNSLRNYIVDKGWPFILAVKNKLVPGGLFGVDDEAAAQITGMYRVLKKLPDFAADA